MHPGFYGIEAGGDCGEGGGGDGEGGNVQLDVISVTVVVESMLPDDVAEGE